MVPHRSKVRSRPCKAAMQRWPLGKDPRIRFDLRPKPLNRGGVSGIRRVRGLAKGGDDGNDQHVLRFRLARLATR